MRKISLVAAVAVLAATSACKKTGEGEYQVEKPVVGTQTDTVNTPSVETGTVKDTISVPDVDVKSEKKEVNLPKVEVTILQDGTEDGMPSYSNESSNLRTTFPGDQVVDFNITNIRDIGWVVGVSVYRAEPER